MPIITGTLAGWPAHTIWFQRVRVGIEGETFYLPERYPVTTGPDGSFAVDLPPTDISETVTFYRVTIPTDGRPIVFDFSLQSQPAQITLAELYFHGGPSGEDPQTLSDMLAAHMQATSAHGVTGRIVGTTDPQVLDNKTIDCGTY